MSDFRQSSRCRFGTFGRVMLRRVAAAGDGRQSISRRQAADGAPVSMGTPLWFSAIAVAASLTGCAAPERVPTEQSPDALIQWLNSEGRNRMAIHGDPTPPLKFRATTLRKNCEASGAQFTAAVTALVFKDRRSTNNVYSTSINDFMSCMKGEQALWGATMSVDNPELLNGVVTSGNDFYGVIQLRYLDAAQAREEANRRAEQARRLREEVLACQGDLAKARARLREQPQIGGETQLGTVIDVRLPMVQIQLNKLERQRRGRDQEWVKAELLDVNSTCR